MIDPACGMIVEKRGGGLLNESLHAIDDEETLTGLGNLAALEVIDRVLSGNTDFVDCVIAAFNDGQSGAFSNHFGSYTVFGVSIAGNFAYGNARNFFEVEANVALTGETTGIEGDRAVGLAVGRIVLVNYAIAGFFPELDVFLLIGASGDTFILSGFSEANVEGLFGVVPGAFAIFSLHTEDGADTAEFVHLGEGEHQVAEAIPSFGLNLDGISAAVPGIFNDGRVFVGSFISGEALGVEPNHAEAGVGGQVSFIFHCQGGPVDVVLSFRVVDGFAFFVGGYNVLAVLVVSLEPVEFRVDFVGKSLAELESFGRCAKGHRGSAQSE